MWSPNILEQSPLTFISNFTLIQYPEKKSNRHLQNSKLIFFSFCELSKLMISAFRIHICCSLFTRNSLSRQKKTFFGQNAKGFKFKFASFVSSILRAKGRPSPRPLLQLLLSSLSRTRPTIYNLFFQVSK